MNPELDLAGRRALITGGGRGIGRAIASELARRGAHALIAGRTRARLEDACAAIRDAGGEATPLAGDINAPEFQELLTGHGPVDLLIHNAAAFADYAPLERVPDEEVDRVLATIVRAPLLLTKRLLPAMKERRGGRIVFVGSIAGEAGAEGQVAYSAAKSALVGLVRSLAAETARFDVTCNLVQPGLIATERIAESVGDEWQRRILANTALGRAGRPEDVARVVGFLCSQAADYLTGAVLPVSGGFGVGLYAREDRAGHASDGHDADPSA